MQLLRIKKFFLDYLIGSFFIVVLFFALIGNFTIMDTKGILTLTEKCSSSSTDQDILSSAQLVLRNDEYCEFEEPCDGLRSLRCEGTATVADLPMQIVAQDLLIIRVKNQLIDQYGFAGYRDRSTFRVPIGLVKFILFYLLVLVEACAVLFALWRQKLLRQTFSLSTVSKTDHLLRPFLIGIVIAMLVLALNYQVDRFIGFPDNELIQAKLAYFQTLPGIILAIFIAPFVEELIFRGVMLRSFIQRNRILLGVVITSVFFAALHLLSEEGLGWRIYKFAVFFPISAILCWSFIKQRNLWSPIFLHAGYNVMIVVAINVFG